MVYRVKRRMREELAKMGVEGFYLSVMKTAKSLIAVIACSICLSVPVLGDGWATLAGHNDSVSLAPGEMAFVVTVSERLTIQYTKRNKRPVQFELGADRETFARVTSTKNVMVPSTANPFALVGPCEISLKTPGVVSMKVVKAPVKTK